MMAGMALSPDDRDHQNAHRRKVWDNQADHYDKQIGWWERRVFGEDNRAWACGRAEGRVLEVAVGTGRNLAHYDDQVTVVGVDLSPEMLALAHEYAAELGRDADLREGDAAHLPFPDASFDTVVCALALCSIPDPQRAIAEMRRVLVPGGQLLLLDHVGSAWPPLYGAQWLVEQLTRRLAGEYQTRRQRPLVEAAGFALEESERLKGGTIERIRARKPVES
jgi:ubiquinone/menaquinone biosynthesis C-methylase UbiE